MRTATQIRDSIDALRAELDAIVVVSTKEDRDLTDEEDTRVKAISQTEIPALNRTLATAEAIEAERNQRILSRVHPLLENASQTTNGDTSLASFKIPARARAHGNLQAFNGPDAEREAYITGQAVLAGIYGNAKAGQWCREHGLVVRNTMTENTNTAGGFLVPDEMSSALIRLREARGVFPQYANRVPMGSDSLQVPRLLSDATAYWVGEGQEITASTPGMGAAIIRANKLAGLVKISSELDEDAVISVGDMVTASLAYAMADAVDSAAFLGDGTSTYGGVVGLKNAIHANATVTSATGNDAANNQDLVDFEAVAGAFPTYPGASPRWFMSKPVFYASAARLADAAGGNTNQTIAGGATETTFLGYPVTFVNVMTKTTTTLASTIIAYFGDLRLGASYGVRRAPRTEISTERYFEYDLIGVKMTERVGILIHETGSDINTRPIIAMKTAA